MITSKVIVSETLVHVKLVFTQNNSLYQTDKLVSISSHSLKITCPKHNIRVCLVRRIFLKKFELKEKFMKRESLFLNWSALLKTRTTTGGQTKVSLLSISL